MEAAAIPPDQPERSSLELMLGAGKYEIVTIDDLHIDPAYQRDLSRDLVERIKNEWDTAAAGAIVVSRRPSGDLYIVNGQHRTAAAAEKGMTEILAQVIDGLDSVQEAELRLMGNTRRPDTAQERFRAQVAAGHQESIAIQEITRQFDTRINPSPDTKSGINTVAGVEELYRHDGKGVMLTRVLEVVRDAFGSIGGKQASASTLKAVGWFLDKHSHEIDARRFRERLATVGIEDLDRKGRSFKAAMGGALWMNYYRAMVETYNERLAQGARLEPKTGGWSRSGHAGDSYGNN